ncbi:hypothetical protein [Pedobacter sp. PACM 27299]|uniref:hypothetical protein n=1 Tax=Pedobacter sp. PACM 27299 TaxID=1727164 RepID=UPI0012FA229E|nr:hypothetical protein [Pedobacter sp. PACM 27299]
MSCTIFVLALFLTIFSACKKEYTDFPYHNIEQFQVSIDEKSNIDAVIKGDSIILYWPPFINIPDSITPQITVSERASILPASGKKVAYSDKTSYRVTAQDGNTKVYHLKRLNNQPIFDFELARTMTRGGLFLLSGSYFVADTSKTKVYLIDKSKKETRINPIALLTTARLNAAVPAVSVIDTGSYHIKMITGSRTLIKGPFKIAR